MAAKPSAPPRPVIGICPDFSAPANGTAIAKVAAGYIDCVLAAGGLPLIIPPLKKEQFADLDLYLNQCSGVIITGGQDLDPRKYGQPTSQQVRPMPARREDSDRYVLAKAVEKKLPVFGIGVGMQLINVYFGGTLYLHLPFDMAKAMPHFDPSGGVHRHMVNLEPNTMMDDIYGGGEIRVNSMHHQAINQLGRRLRVSAKALDGVIEAIESTDPNWFCLGVQWHPECDTAAKLDMQLFENFVMAAGKYVPMTLPMPMVAKKAA
ncbi:MAG: gamma-glutamyl-gamma-aminobutyrate hydrolase family protein [Gemmataceae bacterium]